MKEQKPQDFALEDWKKNNTQEEEKPLDINASKTSSTTSSDEVSVIRVLVLFVASIIIGLFFASPLFAIAGAQTGFDVVIPEGHAAEQRYDTIGVVIWIVV